MKTLSVVAVRAGWQGNIFLSNKQASIYLLIYSVAVRADTCMYGGGGGGGREKRIKKKNTKF